MQFSTLFLLTQATLIAAGSISPRQTDGSDFLIYAYGDDVGGLPIFTSGGAAYIGDHALLKDSNAAPARFSRTGSVWTAQPNTTDASWSNLTFAIPNKSSSSHEVSFIEPSNNTADVSTDSFTQFGAFVLVDGKTDGVQSLWYGLPSGTPGVWTLNWNDTGDENPDKVYLTLRDLKPTLQS